MLLGYYDNKLQAGDKPNAFGANFDKDYAVSFLETEWEIIAPFSPVVSIGQLKRDHCH